MATEPKRRYSWFWCETHGDFAIRPLCPQCEQDAKADTVTLARGVYDAIGAELMKYRALAGVSPAQAVEEPPSTNAVDPIDGSDHGLTPREKAVSDPKDGAGNPDPRGPTNNER